MAYILEQAGGLAVSGKEGRILDIQPKKIHERESFNIRIYHLRIIMLFRLTNLFGLQEGC